MMPRSALVVVALVMPAALSSTASVQEFPGKGDNVYIAATFTDVEAGLTPVKAAAAAKGYQIRYLVKPCAAMEILDANPKKARWVAVDRVLGGTVHLEGAWVPRMHRSQADCESQYSAEGEPRVKRSGDKFKIAPTQPKQALAAEPAAEADVPRKPAPFKPAA